MAANAEHNWRNIRTCILRWATYLGTCIGGLVGLVLLINSYDADLDPRAAVKMLVSPPPVPDAENAYFVHFGLGVAEGQDSHAHGIRLVGAINEWIRAADAGRPGDRSEVDAIIRANELVPWRGDEAMNLCGEHRVDCLSAYKQNRTEIEKLVSDNRLRLARYHSLYKYKHFREVSLNRATLEWVPHLVGAEHETTLGLIALRAMDGDVSGAMHELAADTAYWRRVLAGASTLMTKTASVTCLARNYALASKIAARYQGNPVDATQLKGLLKPLTEDEKNWTGALASEFQGLAYLYQSLRNDSREQGFFSEEKHFWDSVLAVVFYKPNATINLNHEYFERVLKLTHSPPHELINLARQIDFELDSYRDPFRADIVYNPVGKILVAIGAVSAEGYARYVARTHNLDGAIRLLRLQLDIYGKDVAIGDVRALLAKSPSQLLDPYTGRPFSWEPSKRELWFEGVNPTPGNNSATKQRIAIRI